MRNVGGTRITSDPTKRAAAGTLHGGGEDTLIGPISPAPRRPLSAAPEESSLGRDRPRGLKPASRETRSRSARRSARGAESVDRRANSPALVVDADRFRRSENLERGARPLHPDQRAGQLEQDAAPLGRGLGQ